MTNLKYIQSHLIQVYSCHSVYSLWMKRYGEAPGLPLADQFVIHNWHHPVIRHTTTQPLEYTQLGYISKDGNIFTMIRLWHTWFAKMAIVKMQYREIEIFMK